nr:MAG TPA: hypothetical protein [Caudoviricetes sp.]
MQNSWIFLSKCWIFLQKKLDCTPALGLLLKALLRHSLGRLGESPCGN